MTTNLAWRMSGRELWQQQQQKKDAGGSFTGPLFFFFFFLLLPACHTNFVQFLCASRCTWNTPAHPTNNAPLTNSRSRALICAEIFVNKGLTAAHKSVPNVQKKCAHAMCIGGGVIFQLSFLLEYHPWWLGTGLSMPGATCSKKQQKKSLGEILNLPHCVPMIACSIGVKKTLNLPRMLELPHLVFQWKNIACLNLESRRLWSC